MERPNPDNYFMGIALAVRRRANCRGSRVGAIVVVDKRIVSTGYNGTPEGMTNCLDGGCDRCANRTSYPSGTGYDLCICVHAEQNAILAAARFGISVANGTVYTTTQPCFGCVKEMLQAKIQKVFYLHPWIHPDPAVANEYRKIVARIPEGLEHLDVPDPDAAWARNKSSPLIPTDPSTKRTKTSLSNREKWVRPPRS
jgi:dCMP deaminase